MGVQERWDGEHEGWEVVSVGIEEGFGIGVQGVWYKRDGLGGAMRV